MHNIEEIQVDNGEINWEQVRSLVSQCSKYTNSYFLFKDTTIQHSLELVEEMACLMDRTIHSRPPPFVTIKTRNPDGFILHAISLGINHPSGYAPNYHLTNHIPVALPFLTLIPYYWLDRALNEISVEIDNLSKNGSDIEAFMALTLAITQASSHHAWNGGKSLDYSGYYHNDFTNYPLKDKTLFKRTFLPWIMQNSRKMPSSLVIHQPGGIYWEDTSIAIIKLDHYGDAILSLTALSQLYSSLALASCRTTIHYILSPQAESVIIPHAKAHQVNIGKVLIHEFWDDHGSVSKCHGITQDFIEKIKVFPEVDVAIDLRSYPETRPIMNLLRKGGDYLVPLKIGVDFQSKHSGSDTKLHIKSPFMLYGGYSNRAEMNSLVSSIPIWNAPKHNPIRFKEFFKHHPVAINPSATAPAKHPSPFFWLSLIDAFEELGIDWMIAGEWKNLKMDHNKYQYFRGEIPKNPEGLSAFVRDLENKNTSLYICLDSGASHAVAAFSKIPVLTLMSNIVSREGWMPQGPYSTAIGLSSYKAPCYSGTSCCGGKCMNFKVCDVLDAMGLALSGTMTV